MEETVISHEETFVKIVQSRHEPGASAVQVSTVITVTESLVR